jgi:hypothetical protein
VDSEEQKNLLFGTIQRHCDGTEKTCRAWGVTVTTDKYLLNSGQVITDLPSSSRTECSVVTGLRNNLPGTKRTCVCKLGRGAQLTGRANYSGNTITMTIIIIIIIIIAVIIAAFQLSLSGSSSYTSNK